MSVAEPVVSILVGDDTAKNLVAMQALLERPGLRVLVADSGEAALELLLVHEVALALIDLNMPGMDGFELAELMRGNSRTRAIPLIFITAALREAAATFRGYQAGAVDFINKPFPPEILRSKVEIFVELFEQRKLLDIRLAELQRALQEQRAAEAALREADRRKDEFLAVLAHELRNPLAPIRTALDVFELLGPPDPRLTKARQAASRQVDHMTKLVNDLLDTARISRGKISLHRSPCDLARIAVDTAEDYRSTLAASRLQVTIDAPLPLVVDGDPTRLAQCIGNLLHNANKFSPAGTTVTVRARRCPNAYGRDMACVEVEDQGSGISADMLPCIFAPFTQANQEPSRAQGGLGLGLALVKGLVELHGGQVKAESAGRGQGARFTIMVPLAGSQQLPQDDGPALETGPALKLLVVDDNRDYLHTMAAALRAMGHAVWTAERGPEAVDMASRLQPDVVLCDLGLPDGMDGFAVARALRRNPACAKALLVAISGYGGESDREQALEAGFDHHIPKPVSLSELPLHPRR